MGCSLSAQRRALPEPAAKRDPAAPASSSADQLTSGSIAPQTNSASSRDSGLSLGAAKHGSANTPLLASPGGSQPHRDEAVNERFSSALDVLSETLQVPVARILLADSSQRSLWFNATSASGKAGDVMVVSDTSKDARFRGALFVPWPPLTRSYAAVPVVCSQGRVLGSLEVLDSKPRTFHAGSLDVLRSFAAMIAKDVERDEAGEQHRKERVDTALLVRRHTVLALSCFPEPVLLCDVASDDKWPIVWVNDRFARETGVPERSCLSSGFWQLFSALSGGDSRERTAQGIRERQPFVLRVAGACVCMLLEFRPATMYHLGAAAPDEGEPAFKDSLDASIVDAMNSAFYFGVVKEVVPRQAGKQSELQRQHTQPAAALPQLSATLWEQEGHLAPPSPLPQPMLLPRDGPVPPGGAHGQQWQQPMESSRKFVSPFQARRRQHQLGEELQQWAEEEEDCMHQVVPVPQPLQSQQQLEAQSSNVPQALHLPRRHSVDVRRSMDHQAGPVGGASLRRSVDYQRQAALWQQQSARAATSLALARRGSVDAQAQKQLAGALQEWGGPSPRTVADQGTSNLSSLATLEGLVDSSGAPADDEVPEGLKDIKLGRILGRGGFGAVFRGTWRGADVAVKVIKTCVDPASAELTAPMLEGLLSKNLNHPNIVQTYEFGLKTGEVPGDGFVVPEQSTSPSGALQEVWIVQQYCNHGTLADAIERGWLRIGCEPTGPPNMKHILEAAQEVSSALLYLHRQDVLHGDLTAANVLLTGVRHRGRTSRTFQCKVADFGLSRFMEAAQLTTATVGTVSHMPLELISSGKLSKAVDVFAFGTLCWEMYMGRRAWAGRCIAQILFARTEAKERLALPDDAPPAFKRLVESCLDEDSSRRPSFDEILDSISSQLAAQEGTHATT